LCAYYLVILPLPADTTAVVPYAQHPQLVPFSFVADFLAKSGFELTSPGTWASALISSEMYSVVFNVFLFVPLGMFLRFYFKRKWWQALLAGFAMSLFFEVSQLTGLFGMYLHPYRLFDVDDLMVNTFGAMLGFWIMGPARKALPDMDVVNQEARERGIRVSLTRRVLAFVLDLVIAYIVLAIFMVATLLLRIFPSEMGAGAQSVLSLPGLDLVVVLLIFFVLVPQLMRGRTLGQRVLKLVVVRPDATRARWYQFLARYTLLFLLIFTIPYCLNFLSAGSQEPLGATEASTLIETFFEGLPLLTLLWMIAVVGWLISLLVRNHKAKKRGQMVTLLYELMSNTRVMTVEGAEALRESHKDRTN
jgi:glycopeptide antibiotics resistance protein